MKYLAICAIAVALLFSPVAQAQCSGYYCPYGACPWYEHLADSGWENGCGSWYYGGQAYADVSTLCNASNNHHGTITSNGGFINGGLIKQGFTTFSTGSGYDEYSLQFTIDLSGMQSGDSLSVIVKDVTTNTSTTVATYTSDTWCNGQSFTFTNPGWAGHNLEVRFEAYVGHTTTKVKIDDVTFWQKV
jgi:hypothetical protein